MRLQGELSQKKKIRNLFTFDLFHVSMAGWQNEPINDKEYQRKVEKQKQNSKDLENILTLVRIPCKHTITQEITNGYF